MRKDSLQHGAKCARCRERRQFGDPPWDHRLVNGKRRLVCENCKGQLAAERRKLTAERLLAKGRPAGTSEYRGKVMTVTVLPEKKRH
jgi:hypothetical protein